MPPRGLPRGSHEAPARAPKGAESAPEPKRLQRHSNGRFSKEFRAPRRNPKTPRRRWTCPSCPAGGSALAAHLCAGCVALAAWAAGRTKIVRPSYDYAYENRTTFVRLTVRKSYDFRTSIRLEIVRSACDWGRPPPRPKERPGAKRAPKTLETAVFQTSSGAFAGIPADTMPPSRAQRRGRSGMAPSQAPAPRMSR